MNSTDLLSAMSSTLTEMEKLSKFDASEARDSSGKWSSGGEAGKDAKAKTEAALAAGQKAHPDDHSPTGKAAHLSAAAAHLEAASAHHLAAIQAQASGDRVGDRFHRGIALEHERAARSQRAQAHGYARAMTIGAAVGALGLGVGAVPGALGGAYVHHRLAHEGAENRLQYRIRAGKSTQSDFLKRLDAVISPAPSTPAQP